MSFNGKLSPEFEFRNNNHKKWRHRVIHASNWSKIVFKLYRHHGCHPMWNSNLNSVSTIILSYYDVSTGYKRKRDKFYFQVRTRRTNIWFFQITVNFMYYFDLTRALEFKNNLVFVSGHVIKLQWPLIGWNLKAFNEWLRYIFLKEIFWFKKKTFFVLRWRHYS